LNKNCNHVWNKIKPAAKRNLIFVGNIPPLASINPHSLNYCTLINIQTDEFTYRQPSLDPGAHLQAEYATGTKWMAHTTPANQNQSKQRAHTAMGIFHCVTANGC
jgi:hypothetical protein